MVSTWNGKTEPFKIHAEGWALIIIMAILAALAMYFVFNGLGRQPTADQLFGCTAKRQVGDECS